MSEDQEFKTSSIGVVAYLKYQGLSPLRMTVEGTVACWYFTETPTLLDLVEDYDTNEAAVQPKEYNRVFGLTRSEMLNSIRPSRSRERR